MRPSRRSAAALLLLLPLAAGACRGGGDARDTTGAASARNPAAPTPNDNSPSAWRVTERGFGPLGAGMEARTASDALSGALATPTGTACQYLAWRGGPAGVRVMAEGGRIVRVEVNGGTVATDAGARVGDTEARVRELYAGRTAVTPHKYDPAGRYITVVPAAPSDSAYRIVFETDGSGRVTRYRAGLRPQVEYVEGCA